MLYLLQFLAAMKKKYNIKLTLRSTHKFTEYNFQWCKGHKCVDVDESDCSEYKCRGRGVSLIIQNRKLNFYTDIFINF